MGRVGNGERLFTLLAQTVYFLGFLYIFLNIGLTLEFGRSIVFRAAAGEQLKEWANRAQAELIGGQEGAREFKRLNGISADSAKSGAVKVPNIAKGLLYVLPYAVFSLLIAAVCWIADNQVFKVILLMIFMPAAILGQATGVIVYPREVVYDKGLETEYTVIEGATSGLSVFAVIAVFVVISCVVFLAAYARKIRQSRDTFNSFMSEIVMNEKFRNR